MEVGVHLPQLDLTGHGRSVRQVRRTVDAAVALGFGSLSANDHLTFSRPWLDGPTLLAAVAERAGDLGLMTSVALPVLRGPVPLAAALVTLAELARGSVIAGVGPGSSAADYELVGIPFNQRFRRFDEAVPALRAALGDAPVPVWVASWGSPTGLRRVARYGDGWLASAYNTTPERFAAALRALTAELERSGRTTADFPHALATMWVWVTEDAGEAERILGEVLAPAIGRPPDSLRERVCIGSAGHCTELLSAYAEAGCRRVQLWPVADEARQLDLMATRVLPRVSG